MIRRLTLVIGVFLLQACTVTFVQPYDEKLVDGTEAFYKEVSKGLIEAESKSLEHRNPVIPLKPESNPGHISHYKLFYSSAMVSANSLIIRAMVNRGKVDEIALSVHKEIETIISEAVPSNCKDGKSVITEKITLTLQNYLDLKCLISNWEVQHLSAQNETLKKGNWEGRQISLMNMIVNIQKAESFKYEAQVN